MFQEGELQPRAISINQKKQLNLAVTWKDSQMIDSTEDIK